jgi:hypothetical protein
MNNLRIFFFWQFLTFEQSRLEYADAEMKEQQRGRASQCSETEKN